MVPAHSRSALQRSLALLAGAVSLGLAAPSAGAAKPAVSRSAAAQPAIDVVAFNLVRDMPLLKNGSRGPVVVRAQILLDRA